MFYRKILQEKELLEQELQAIQTELPMLPTGRIVCATRGNGEKWYRDEGNTRSYISKDNRAVAEKLARKRLLVTRQSDIDRKLKGVNAYLKANDPALDMAPRLLKGSSKLSKLLAASYKPISREIAAWEDAPYPKYDKYPHQLKYETVNGLRVRSKSESLIALMLYTNRIPFHYEEALPLGSMVLHPDFTIRHPVTGETYYWEHFGRLDLPEYRKSMLNKMLLYMDSGILPSDKLIITYETADSPLGATDIQYQLDKHFL